MKIMGMVCCLAFVQMDPKLFLYDIDDLGPLGSIKQHGQSTSMEAKVYSLICYFSAGVICCLDICVHDYRLFFSSKHKGLSKFLKAIHWESPLHIRCEIKRQLCDIFLCNQSMFVLTPVFQNSVFPLKDVGGARGEEQDQ